MRPLKYRAWDKEKKEMLYDVVPFWNGVCGPELWGYCGIMGEHSDRPIGDDLIVMEFTGLYDKNDQEIWEGDILKLTCAGPDLNGKVVSVIYSMGAYRDSYYRWELYNKSDAFEVIGNIYENKELLHEPT